MGDYNSCFDVFSYPLGRCDVVFGAQWLHTLGPILWDFAKLWIKFSVNGKKTHIRLTTRVFQHHQFTLHGNLLRKNSHGVIAQLHFIQMQPSAVSTTPLDLQQILDRYACVFVEPMGLPPSRTKDHRIMLLPGSVPPNIRPYCYPFHYKTEIEMLVCDLLKQGVIHRSTSSFSSPVLLVRKKDGSWCLCINFRALNHITIKDKFPIPVVYELLDELHGGSFFLQVGSSF